MRSLFLSLLLPLIAQPVCAIDWDKHCEDKPLCLTSFVWCERSNDDGNCDYPDRVYPLRTGANVGRAALLWSHEYSLTWRGTDSNHPVQLEWRVSSDDSEKNDTDSYVWQRNFTDGETSFSFEFADLAEEIVDDDSEIDIMAIKGRASDLFGNSIRISQPEREYAGVDDSSDVFDYADAFAVLDGWAEDNLESQRKEGRRDEFNKWRLGVGIGVGLGVPIFMAAAFAGGFFFGKSRGKRSAMPVQKVTS